MSSIDDSKHFLVIGGTSRIGGALALAISALPRKPCVMVAGRRKERLEHLKKAGLEMIEVIDTDGETLKIYADEVVELKYRNVSKFLDLTY
jgi:short-subunit dehydrogenase involved in D-alanine esterification of teichoic acids